MINPSYQDCGRGICYDSVYDFEVPPKQVYKFVIPPKVAHAIKNIGEKDNILIAFNTVAHNSKKPDVISEILMNK